MSELSADMLEIFSSIQGEGLLVGLRQIFMRFHACNLECIYCDTEQTSCPDNCLIEKTPGRRDFSRTANPITLERVVALLERWQRGWPAVHHSISLTGGEPLLHVKILHDWLPVLRSKLPIYLETNGILPQALASIIEFIDYVGMDIKLPSTSGYTELWGSHREFLEIAVRKNVFVKTVIKDATEDWEIIKACELIASIDRKVPLVLQPITLNNGVVGISSLRALELQEIACEHLAEVRIVPQTHKFLGQL
jgi:7-carboxy-7-deazaguanine synthase